MKWLSLDFYARDTGLVARELLGKVLARRVDGELMQCRIVETEAYFGQGDPASHAARGRTKRNDIMFGPPGRAYVYFNYGMHYLFNVVTEEEGKAGAVLIRAVEPLTGVQSMIENRPVLKRTELTSGPAKLTQALAIGLAHNGRSLSSLDLGIVDTSENGFKIISTGRIGISAGRDLNYRFLIAENKFVSRCAPGS